MYGYVYMCVHAGEGCCRGQRHITPRMELEAAVNHLTWILQANSSATAARALRYRAMISPALKDCEIMAPIAASDHMTASH